MWRVISAKVSTNARDDVFHHTHTHTSLLPSFLQPETTTVLGKLEHRCYYSRWHQRKIPQSSRFTRKVGESNIRAQVSHHGPATSAKGERLNVIKQLHLVRYVFETNRIAVIHRQLKSLARNLGAFTNARSDLLIVDTTTRIYLFRSYPREIQMIIRVKVWTSKTSLYIIF
ncbi:hypothetical protein CI102_4148 [Trichoderma harzianum]|nr:hypothetical protein CI102_4148 [Trichoderma harzianum]